MLHELYRLPIVSISKRNELIPLSFVSVDGDQPEYVVDCPKVPEVFASLSARTQAWHHAAQLTGVRYSAMPTSCLAWTRPGSRTAGGHPFNRRPVI